MIADPPTTVPIRTEAAVTVPATIEPEGSAFDPPLLGRLWNSELVVVDTDVVTFIDLNKGEIRSAVGIPRRRLTEPGRDRGGRFEHGLYDLAR